MIIRMDIKLSELRKCQSCGKNIPISDFYKDVTNNDDLSVNCKNCIKKYFKQFKN